MSSKKYRQHWDSEEQYLQMNWFNNLRRNIIAWCTLMQNGGRLMSCCYGGAVQPSDPNSAFFEARPNSDRDSYYCGCYGWD